MQALSFTITQIFILRLNSLILYYFLAFDPPVCYTTIIFLQQEAVI